MHRRLFNISLICTYVCLIKSYCAKIKYSNTINRSIVGLPVAVHVRKLCSECAVTYITCCNVHFTKYSIFNSSLIHYLVVINFVILSNIVIILCYIYFYVTCRGISRSNPIDVGEKIVNSEL